MKSEYRPWLVAFCAMAAYVWTVRFGIVAYDDRQIVEAFDQLSQLSSIPRGFTRSFAADLVGLDPYYRPVLNTFFTLLCWTSKVVFGGFNPGFFHAVNVALHASVSVLLFRVLKRMGASETVATILALLQSVHPGNAFAVSWIGGVNDLILGNFILSALLSRSAWAFGLWFLAALLTKENALALAVLGPLARGKDWKRFAQVSVGALVVWFVMRSFAELAPGSGQAVVRILRFAPKGFMIYLGELFFPFGLPTIPTFKDGAIWRGVFGLAGIGAILHFGGKRSWYGLFWFAFFITPTFLGTMDSGDFFYRGDRLYLSSLGIWFALIPVAQKLENWRHLVPVTSIMASMFAGLVMSYSKNFKDNLTFYQSAADGAPSVATFQVHLADAFLERFQFEKAESLYLNALRLNPTERMGNNNLGVLYLRLGKYDLARQYFQKELQVNPGYVTAMKNLELVKETESKSPTKPAAPLSKEARRRAEEAVNRANRLFAEGKAEEAKRVLEEFQKSGGKVEMVNGPR